MGVGRLSRLHKVAAATSAAPDGSPGEYREAFDMDTALFERLLNEEEGATLDFKQKQYPFAGIDEEKKSEILKDILAFANAWRRADAYILIGVEEVRGGRSNVVGVIDHLDDHSLQQFVNHKTNRPLHFSYEAFTFDRKQVGIIKIDQQAVPST